MYLKLKSIREECGGCPTSYSGKTVDGKDVEMYLRHGVLWIEVGSQRIVNERTYSLDGVCGLEDFKEYARKNGHTIDCSEAEWSSRLQEDEEAIAKLFADRVNVTFLRDYYSVSAKKVYKEGEKHAASLKMAQALIDVKYAIVESEHDRKKLEKQKTESAQTENQHQ